ncbi:DUF5133 domain-containing protein, partial [Streptomyces sp. NPDC004658]
YTLCVATGTRDVDMALIAARHRLSGARRMCVRRHESSP